MASRGDPDLRVKGGSANVVFTNVAEVYRSEMAVENVGQGVVVVTDGEITCVGDCLVAESGYEMVDLKGGSITPGLTTVGSYVGLMEIRQEKSTWDGVSTFFCEPRRSR